MPASYLAPPRPPPAPPPRPLCWPAYSYSCWQTVGTKPKKSFISLKYSVTKLQRKKGTSPGKRQHSAELVLQWNIAQLLFRSLKRFFYLEVAWLVELLLLTEIVLDEVVLVVQVGGAAVKQDGLRRNYVWDFLMLHS